MPSEKYLTDVTIAGLSKKENNPLLKAGNHAVASVFTPVAHGLIIVKILSKVFEHID